MGEELSLVSFFRELHPTSLLDHLLPSAISLICLEIGKVKSSSRHLVEHPKAFLSQGSSTISMVL